MEVPILDLRAQYVTIRKEVSSAVLDVLESQMFILGPQVGALEKEVSELCGTSSAVGVASGTDALLLSLKALGVGPHDSVVTVPYTFFATAGAIVNLGARPLFVDIHRDSFNMDPEKLEAILARECSYNLSTGKLLHKTTGTTIRAIVPVHLFGQCADMEEILRIAQRYDMPVVEDSCQAIGARYAEGRAGALGDAGCFSFFPSKNLGGAGDGGMIVTRSDDLAERLRLLRSHGARPKYYHATVGFNSRLDELQAAILRAKLSHMAEWTEARQNNAKYYENEIRAAGLTGQIEVPSVRPGRTHIFHQFVIRCSDRDALRSHLKECGVGTEVYYPVSLHEQECFRCLGYQTLDFPESRAASQETLALPVYPELTADQKSHVVSSLVSFYQHRI